jgi:hypothetical protein
LRQGLTLGQTGADEQAQAPQAVRLCGSPPRSCAAFKLHLELALKLVAKVRIVLGCAQQAVHDGDQGDMPFDGAEVPQLILVQPFRLAFLVVDFNGPEVATNAGDPRGLTHQAVALENSAIKVHQSRTWTLC